MTSKPSSPDARVARMDLDTTRTRTAYERIISDFQQGKTDILIGTQMVSKGLTSTTSALGHTQCRHHAELSRLPRLRARLPADGAGCRTRRTEEQARQGGATNQKHRPSHHPASHCQRLRSHGRRAVCRTPDVPLPALLPPGVRLPEEPERDPLDLMAQTMAAKLRTVFGNWVLGPDKPPVARVQTCSSERLSWRWETNAPWHVPASCSSRCKRRWWRKTASSRW